MSDTAHKNDVPPTIADVVDAEGSAADLSSTAAAAAVAAAALEEDEDDAAYSPSGAAVASAVAAASEMAVLPSPEKKTKRWTWKKPEGKPKRPLSAYNLFFGDIRKELMEEQAKKSADAKGGGLGFKALAVHVSERWKKIDPKQMAHYESLAKEAKEKYQVELADWKQETEENAKLPAVGQESSSQATEADCSSCPVCLALKSSEEGCTFESAPVFIIASEEYASQFTKSPNPIEEATDMEEEDSKPAATTPGNEGDVEENSKEIPVALVASVLPDGTITSSGSSDTQDLVKLEQNVATIWNQLIVMKHTEEQRKSAEGASKSMVVDVSVYGPSQE